MRTDFIGGLRMERSVKTTAGLEDSAAETLPAVPGFELLGLLGRGGMGAVYRARQLELDRVVALKVLQSRSLLAGELRERFHREALAVARLQHPNIVQLYEVGQHEEMPYLVMEYVGGGDLSSRIPGRPWKPREAASLVATLARAIHYSHQQGIVHRDLKPGNILLTPEGVPKVTDFGLARWLNTDTSTTRTGQIIGTPAYIAPEQASGVVKNIGPACDVYALGAILYELLTGRPPLVTDDPMQTLLLALTAEPLPPRRLQPRIARDLETICLKCLEKKPADRYATAGDLADDLDRYLQGAPIAARPVGRLVRCVKWCRRRPAAASLLIASGVFLAILLLGGAWYNRQLQQEVGRTRRIADGGRALAHWVLFDHVAELQSLAGTTAARERVVNETLAYLDVLVANVGTDAQLMSDIAAGYERVAEVQGDPASFHLGHPEAALASYGKALRLRKRLLEFEGHTARRRLDCAHTLIAMGRVYTALGKETDARAAYREALSLLDMPSEPSQQDDVVRYARSQAVAGLADLEMDAGRLDRALTGYRSAMDVLDQLGMQAGERREVEEMRAVLHGRMGSVHELQGDLKEASRHYDEVVSWAHRMKQVAPSDPRVVRWVSHALVARGDIHSRTGDLDEAQACYEEAVRLRRAVAKDDPSAQSAQRDLAVVLERLGVLCEMRGRYDDAAANFAQALSLVELPQDASQAAVEQIRFVRELHGRLASAHLRCGKPDEAKREAQLALALAEQLVEQHGATDPHLQGLAEACVGLGTVAVAALDPRSVDQMRRSLEEALALFERAKGLLQRIETPTADQRALVASAGRLIEVTQEALARLDTSGAAKTEQQP